MSNANTRVGTASCQRRRGRHWIGTLLVLLATGATNFAAAAAATDVASDFVRLRADGRPLAPGPAAKAHWACTLDTRTGLIWERKSGPGGLHDGHSSFTPYRREWEKGGRIVVYRDTSSGQCARQALAGGSCNIGAYVDAINQARLCGRDDWRLPTMPELIEVTRRPAPARRDPLLMDLVPGWYWTATDEHGGVPYPRVALLPPGSSPQVFDGTYFLWLVSGAGKEKQP